MSLLASRAPSPALPDHPAFALMVLATLERFRCTLGEVREDYWLGRAWRALAGDPSLAGRVARVGLGSALLTGPNFGPAPPVIGERAPWFLYARERLIADTGKTPEALRIEVAFAAGPVQVAEGRVISLLAQTVAGDARWGDLAHYAGDLEPVVLTVAQATSLIVAA